MVTKHAQISFSWMFSHKTCVQKQVCRVARLVSMCRTETRNSQQHCCRNIHVQFMPNESFLEYNDHVNSLDRFVMGQNMLFVLSGRYVLEEKRNEPSRCLLNNKITERLADHAGKD